MGLTSKKRKNYILITCTNFPGGGAGANYLNLFCRGLKENNNDVSVWLLKGFAFGKSKVDAKRENISAEGIKYTFLGRANRPTSSLGKIIEETISFLRLISYLIKIVPQRKQISILLYNNELLFNIPIYLISKLATVNIISFVPEFYDKSNYNTSFLRKIKWYGFLINFYYLNKKSYRIIVFSNFLKTIYLNQGVSEERIIVQPNLTDFDYWQTNKSEINYTLGYSGTPSVKDGVTDLLAAIHELKKKNVYVNLLIVGDNIFGKSLIPELKQYCESLSIAKQVKFTGLVDLETVKKCLAECQILAITRPNIKQTQAGFPTKLGEYFALGKQILVTNFGDIESYFTPMKEIVTANCGDPVDISKKIEWMINNRVEAENIRIKGYNKATSLLSYKTSIQNILARIK